MVNQANNYLSAQNSPERVQLLQDFRNDKQWLPLSLSKDLLSLNLQNVEHSAILRCTDNSDKVALEDFLTRGIYEWQQNVASTALWEWATRTDCLLWHRTIPLSHDIQIPQRVSYTLLDLAWFGAGAIIIRQFLAQEGLEEMSAAFLALSFQRALQYSVESERLVEIAINLLQQLHQGTLGKDKAIVQAIGYLIRYAPNTFYKEPWDTKIGSLWPDLVRGLIRDTRNKMGLEGLKSQLRKKPNTKNLAGVLSLWPALWARHELDDDVICTALKFFSGLDLKQEYYWKVFGGIPVEKLGAAVESIKDDMTFVRSLALLGNLIDGTIKQNLLTELKKRITATDNPAVILEEIPMRDRVQLNPHDKSATIFSRIFRERTDFTVIGSNTRAPAFITLDIDREGNGIAAEDAARTRFINHVHRRIKTASNKGDTRWDRLLAAWQNPAEDQLEQISIDARQVEPVFRVCYIETLGKFKGIDKAALKLLDFIRSHDEDIIRAVIRALAGIGTPRANQELVAFLTRPNMSLAIQMEIAQLLSQADLSNLQAELRSAINDLHTEEDPSELKWELREALTGLLQVNSNLDAATMTDTGSINVPTTPELEAQLVRKIPTYSRLSSEAKRALRTAQFFHLQVESAGNLHTIDLSPAIDMQYKALELTFRELFENPCGDLLNTGILQRKLDVIGYARPIPPAMEEFERYIEALPIIQTIPFFSRFKLRKMLRAICQFRRGKRFTLDGLKAFALFFICFGRKKCRYGLENLFPIPGMSDEELFEFCKALHVFQDFRNRAAHEGFHPDASNDLAGIWQDTAKIVENVFVVRDALEELRRDLGPSSGRQVS